MTFLEGMEIGTFLLLPWGVSQAAACDGNFYTIDASRQSPLPGTLPLQKNFRKIDDNFGTLSYGIYAVCNTCKYSGYFSVFNILQQAILTDRKETSSNVCLLSIASIAGYGILINHSRASFTDSCYTFFIITQKGPVRPLG